MRNAVMALAIVLISTVAWAKPPPPQAQPWLGVAMKDGGPGVELTDIMDESPAERAGIRAGDRLVGVNGSAISSPQDLQNTVRRYKVGQVVAVDLVRKGKPLRVKVTIGDMPDRPELQARRWRRLLDHPAPPFELSRVHGTAPTTTKDLAGKVVLIEFLSTWCQPCKSTYKTLGQLQARHATDGLVVLGVSSEEQATLKGFASRESLPFTVAHDIGAALQAKYWASTTPTFVVIDRDGVIRSLGSGAGLAFDHAVFTAERLAKED